MNFFKKYILKFLLILIGGQSLHNTVVALPYIDTDQSQAHMHHNSEL